MMEVLCRNKPSFVELLLENGIIMSKYLNDKKLGKIYRAVSIIFQLNSVVNFLKTYLV